MIENNINNNVNFKGTTDCYVLSDVHQEARKFAEFLDTISKNSKNVSNVLLLNNGDLFGGVYSRNLTKNLLIDFKKKNPYIEVVTTLGNNDFISEPGYDENGAAQNAQTQHSFIKSAIKDFNKAGIKVVCANIKDKSGNIPDGGQPYSTVYRDGDKILITGYCIERKDKSMQDNYNLLKEEETIDLLKKAIDKEKPDAVILLNHDYKGVCKKLKQHAETNGIKIDFTVGGHDHEHSYHDLKERVYHPQAFAREMFNFKLVIPSKEQKEQSEIEDFNSIYPSADYDNKKVEQEESITGLSEEIAPRKVYNLKTRYAHPNPLGTFVADSIKEIANADAGFVIGSAIRSPIEKDDSAITKYDTKTALPRGNTKVSKVELTPLELKDLLSASIEGIYTLKEENGNFFQCSSNVKIVAEKNNDEKSEIKEIYIDNDNILDSKNLDKKYVIAIDGFSARNLENKIDLDSNMLDALETKLKKEAKQPTKQGDYPVFEIICDGEKYV